MTAHSNQIIPGLYLGNVGALRSLLRLDPRLQKEWCVISVIRSTELQGIPRGYLYRHMLVDVDDLPQTNLYPYFKTTYEFISSALNEKKKVLVHCQMGISRSSSILCAFLIRKYKVSPSEAIKFLRQKRSIVDPNPGFRAQLERLYAEVRKGKW